MQNLREAPPRRSRGLAALLGVLALGVILGAGAVLWSENSGQRSGLELRVSASDEVLVGEVFEVAAEVRNESGQTVRDVKISLSLPMGIVYADGRSDVRRTATVGELASGEVYRKVFKALGVEARTGLEGEEKKALNVEVSYLPEGLGKNLVESATREVVVLPAIEVTIEAPTEATSGEEFDWSARYKNVTTRPWKVALDLVAPSGFRGNFKRTELSVEPGEGGELKFRGGIALPAREEIVIALNAMSRIGERDYLVGSGPATIAIAPSELQLSILSSADARGGALREEELAYTIVYKNVGAEPLRNLRVNAALEGAALDAGSVRPGDMGIAGRGVVAWTPETTPTLVTLSPKSEARLTFAVRLTPPASPRRLSEKNAVVTLRVTGEAERDQKKVSATASAETKVVGGVAIRPTLKFRDAAENIVNGGTFPPRVGERTELTLHLEIGTYANDLNDLRVRAVLPSNVAPTEVKKVPVGTTSYDAKSGVLEWEVPRAQGGSGSLTDPLVAIFQLVLTPSVSESGKYAEVVREVSLTGTDKFTGVSLEARGGGALTTELRDDTTVLAGEGVVRK